MAGGRLIDPYEIIGRFYAPGQRTYRILVRHSEAVADKALRCAAAVPALDPDTELIRQAALLHDIGIFLTDSPTLGCHGPHPYVCHGVLGGRLLRSIDLPRHARVCERHVGAGLSAAEVGRQRLPLPPRDMLPVTVEEQIVCYADKFFSKNDADPTAEKPIESIRASLARYGDRPRQRFDRWAKRFGGIEQRTFAA